MIRKAVLVLATILAVASFGAAQPANREFRTLVWNNSHVVSYEKRGNRLVVTMEMIADYEEDRTSQKWPERDFTSIRIDLNNNKRLDSKLDIALGTVSGTDRICPHFILSEWSTSGCGVLTSRSTLKVSFDRSPFHDNAHPIFEYAIPIEELTKHSRVIGFEFKFHSKDRSFTFYPESASLTYSFRETIRLNLDQL